MGVTIVVVTTAQEAQESEDVVRRPAASRVVDPEFEPAEVIAATLRDSEEEVLVLATTADESGAGDQPVGPTRWAAAES